MAVRRFRRGFVLRAVLVLSSLSLFCCLVVIFETVQINSDQLLRASEVNTGFNGFPSLTSHNDKDRNLNLPGSYSFYWDQGRGLKSFPMLKHWEDFQNSPSYNTTQEKPPLTLNGFLGCKDIKAIKIVQNIGRGYTKTVQKGLYRDTEVAVKSVRLDNEDIKRCVLNSAVNRSVEECFIFAKYKLAKEIIMLQQLQHANIVRVSTTYYYIRIIKPILYRVIANQIRAPFFRFSRYWEILLFMAFIQCKDWLSVCKFYHPKYRPLAKVLEMVSRDIIGVTTRRINLSLVMDLINYTI